MTEMIIKGKESIKLNSVAEIVGGQILTRVISKNNDGTSVPVLMPKAINSGVILKNNLGEAILEKDVKSDKYTRKGDVVIKLSTPYDAAYVMESEEGLLIPSFCAAIRITNNELMNAKYLTAYLNTSYVRNLLSLIVSDTNKPMIKINIAKIISLHNSGISTVPCRLYTVTHNLSANSLLMFHSLLYACKNNIFHQIILCPYHFQHYLLFFSA